MLCTLASWLVGQKRVSLLAGLFTCINLAVASPQLVYWPTAEARGRDTLRVVHANVNYHNRQFASALEFFDETDPDILLIVESNPAWMAAMEPLRARLPYVAETRPGKFGIAVMSRYPISTQTKRFGPGRGTTLIVQANIDGDIVQLVGAHPLAPVSPGRKRRRDAELNGIAAWLASADDATILIGDLNTTPWSHAFDSLVETSGLRDTSRGVGLQWSWPAPFWPLAIPIDHCLGSKDVTVLDRRMGPYIGSDHLPLVVDLRINDP